MGGAFTRIQDIRSLRPGDHVAIWDYSRWPLSYQHHGIIWVSGDSPVDIKVCHVWSPLEGFREAQQDSCFRISTLKEFLYNRNERHLRLVDYHTSGMREILSRWGEVHLTKSDLPEVILARCKFLLGLGRGDFHIFNQNCEHAAHWCMTGEQWCKQNLSKRKGVPFENRIPKEDVDALHEEIDQVMKVSRSVVDSVLQLSGSLVYLRVNGNWFVKLIDNGQLTVVAAGNHPETCGRTAFRLECYAKVYNCVKVTCIHEPSNKAMFSRSTLSCFRDLRMKTPTRLRRKTGLQWEYSSLGYMKSMNQHRRYVGIRDDGLLVDVSMRGQGCRVEFVPVESLQGEYTPPDINMVTRVYNHQQSIMRTESRSMRDFEDALKHSDEEGDADGLTMRESETSTAAEILAGNTLANTSSTALV